VSGARLLESGVAAARRDGRPDDPGAVHPDAPTALIADADAETQAMVANTLRLLGYASVAVAAGDEALALADRHAPSLALVVVGVGSAGLSTEDLAQTVAALRPRVPILLLSRERARRDLGDALVGRPAAFLVKPFTADELCRAVGDITS